MDQKGNGWDEMSDAIPKYGARMEVIGGVDKSQRGIRLPTVATPPWTRENTQGKGKGKGRGLPTQKFAGESREKGLLDKRPMPPDRGTCCAITREVNISHGCYGLVRWKRERGDLCGWQIYIY